MCPTLIPVLGSSEHSCGRCTQAEELLSLVTELQEEVGRLSCIEESERLLILYPVFSEKTQADTQVPRPFSTWGNRMTQGIGAMVTSSFAGTINTPPLGLPQVPRCPNTIGTRLCKWYQTAANVMVHLA